MNNEFADSLQEYVDEFDDNSYDLINNADAIENQIFGNDNG